MSKRKQRSCRIDLMQATRTASLSGSELRDSPPRLRLPGSGVGAKMAAQQARNEGAGGGGDRRCHGTSASSMIGRWEQKQSKRHQGTQLQHTTGANQVTSFCANENSKLCNDCGHWAECPECGACCGLCRLYDPPSEQRTIALNTIARHFRGRVAICAKWRPV